MTIDFNALEYGTELIPDRFDGSPNFYAIVEMLCVPVQDRVDACAYLLGMYDIDTKEGVHLDAFGTKIGMTRPRAQIPPSELFTLFNDDEMGDLYDETTGFAEEDEEELGGYIVDENGLDDPDGEAMSDEDYRIILKQKAKTFREKMTDENLIEYFLIYGAPVRIDETDSLVVTAVPDNGGDLTTWERWYISNKGFKPAGIRVEIDDTVDEVVL